MHFILPITICVKLFWTHTKVHYLIFNHKNAFSFRPKIYILNIKGNFPKMWNSIYKPYTLEGTNGNSIVGLSSPRNMQLNTLVVYFSRKLCVCVCCAYVCLVERVYDIEIDLFWLGKILTCSKSQAFKFCMIFYRNEINFKYT